MSPAPARTAAPLRFLALVLGGWFCLRAAILAPGWWDGAGRLAAPPAAAPASAPASATPALTRSTGERHTPRHPAYRQIGRPVEIPPAQGRYLIRQRPYKVAALLSVDDGGSPATPRGGAAPSPPPPPLSPPLPLAPRLPAPVAAPVEARFALAPALSPRPGVGRWSGSAWLLARREQGAPALAPGGTLGGSQAGARLRYRVNGDPARPMALSARLYAPLHRTQGAEVALGLDWQPVGRLAVHVLAERRQALGEEGRSAFAATLYGGASQRLPLNLRLDVYGQAGVVGAHTRDLFADGAARIAAPIGPVELGGALRGAAQPGAARLDAGPELSVDIRAGPAALRLSADWRFRIAGHAAPDSGPALTLAADF